MTQAQSDAEQCGLIPEENNPSFFAQHLSAYAFAKPAVAGHRVLEIGFGDGYGAAYLAETAREMVAVDVTVGNIPRARSKYPRPNLIFQEFDGLRLPFPEAAFDAACTFQVIEHIPEPRILSWVAEIRRVLKPGGRLFVSTLNLDHARKPGKPYEKLIYHEKEFTAPELENLLKQVFPRVTLIPLPPANHFAGAARMASSLTSFGMVRCWSTEGLSVIVPIMGRMSRREDLNLRPALYESAALPTELRRHERQL